MSGNEPLTFASVRDYMLKNDGKGEKYFVLKRPKEAPAVLRKPPSKPSRPHPGIMRNAKMFEDMLSHQMSKGHIPGTAAHAAGFEKENRSDVKSLTRDQYMMKAGSVDSIDLDDQEFDDANINSRDNSGRKPRQVARRTLTIEAQSMDIFLEINSSFGKFLHKKEKKKHKKDQRSATAEVPEYATSSAGPSPYLRRPVTRGTGADFETNLIRSSFRRLVGTSMDTRTVRKGLASSQNLLLIGSPQQLQQVENQRRENEMDIHRTHSDPDFRSTSQI
ncbi:hypothetical protein QZH41_017951 [Actinostola sp. cb2023]|nr:hypothetical protein QZH41_017951 [Actinostola sp. cb2023]